MALMFDPSLRSAIPETHHRFLSNFEELTGLMERQATQNRFVWKEPGDPRLLLNHNLDILWSAHVCKFNQLCQGLISSANQRNYLLYGLIGRSLIEHAAVMRYYFKQRLQPIVSAVKEKGEISGEDLQAVLSQLEKFLRGRRFDWTAFLEGRFDEIRKDVPQEEQQVNVLTCVQKWSSDQPSVGVLYDLFCDLVHPNVGSSLLVMQQWPEGIGFGGLGGKSFGQDLFVKTIAGVLALFKDIQVWLNAMLLLQIRDENGS